VARKSKSRKGDPVLASNRAAGHEFHLLERWEAGIVLLGPEVKSARDGRVNLKDAYARIKDGEVFLFNAHFSPYTHASRENPDPMRPRKLLLHAREIRKLAKELERSGMTLVPTRLYLKDGRIKIEIALARGKKLHDKREALRRRQMDDEARRAMGARRED